MAASLQLATPTGAQTITATLESDPHRLVDLLAANGFPLNTRCAKRGLCKGCMVHLEQGQVRDSVSGDSIAGPAEVLSCLVDWIPESAATLTIPTRSLLAHRPSVTDDFLTSIPTGNDPLFDGKFGLAIDIGTTTVAVILVELATGEILKRASDFNQQIRLGDDVLSRIQLCSSDPAKLDQLQEAICHATILPLMKEACTKAEVALEQVGGIAVAGNSTMLHLLFGVDPSPMGVAPFTPRFLEAKIASANSLGLSGIPDLPVHALPGLAAYVGADIAAGIFATGLNYQTEPALLVDVGTNGEIVLAKGERLYACATAAGPAFEGSGLTCGMRAIEGAIEKIEVIRETNGRVLITPKTIGNKPANQSPGICGSAYIDFLAQARQAGVLGENGRFEPEVIAANPDLFSEAEYGHAILIADAPNPIRIGEPDVALLLQAKAAIAAGIQTLLDREGLNPEEIQTVYLAGGFGMHLDIPHAIVCGLLPGFQPEQITAVGNTSLAGAYLAMLDRTVLEELDRVRIRTEVLELNLDPGFEDRYIDNLILEL